MGDINDSILELIKNSSKILNTRIKAILSPFHITVSQFYVLRELFYNEPLSIQEIIDNLNDSSGNMTVIIKNLSKLGYINKVTNKYDTRLSDITLTESGSKLIKSLIPEYNKIINHLFKNLSYSDKNTLLTLFSKLN